MHDEDRMMHEMATDLVMTLMPKKGKTRVMIEAEIREVHAYLLWEAQQPPASDAEDEDAFDPETGLLKEPSTMPFLEKWAREAEADRAREREDHSVAE